MDEDVLVHELVNSLAFEVEAIATENMVKFTSANGTPLNVKVRLRNKDEPRLVQRGLVSIPKLGKHITTPARIIRSDQTILSFNVLMETELEREPTPKNPKHGFNFLKLGCLGTSVDKDEGPYLPDTSNKKDSRSKTSSKSDSAIINENGAVPPTKMNLETSNVVARNRGGLFGKCKPGGCLDPPFSEDKYPYGLPKTQLHTKLKKTLNLAEDTKEHRNISISNDEPEKAAKTVNKAAKIDEYLTKDETESKPLLNIFARTNSLQNSQTSNHSDSIITYPPELSLSEMINNDQNTKNKSRSKTFRDSSPKQSYEYPESYFIPPKGFRQKEEEQMYSKELSNDQIRFNDRYKDETSQTNGSQRKSLISHMFDSDINKIKPTGFKSISQSGEESKNMDKNNEDMNKQTLTDLILEDNKPQKSSAPLEKNSTTLLGTALDTPLDRNTPPLIETGFKTLDDKDQTNKNPIEKIQESNQLQTKLRSNIQQLPSVIDHITPDLIKKLQDKPKIEKPRNQIQSEILDNMGLAEDITNKNISRNIENLCSIGSIQQGQAPEINKIKPKLDETKYFQTSAKFNNGTKEDKLQQSEPLLDQSNLDISLEEKRFIMPLGKPIKTEINQTFDQDTGPTDLQFKSKKGNDLTKLSLGNKLLNSSLQNLLDNHNLNDTTTPSVTGIKDKQTNPNKELGNYPSKKSSDKMTIRTSSQILPVEEKPKLQTIDSPAYIDDKIYGTELKPLRSDTNAAMGKQTEDNEMPYKQTLKYLDNNSYPIKSSDTNRVQEPTKSSITTGAIQRKILDNLDFVDIQNNDPKETSIIDGTEMKLPQHPTIIGTPTKQIGDIRNKNIHGNQDVDLRDDDKDKICMKTTSDATIIPCKSQTAIDEDEVSGINKAKPIQTDTGEQHVGNYDSKVRVLDATNGKDMIEKLLLDDKNTFNMIVNKDSLSSFNDTKPFQIDRIKQDIDNYTSKVQPIHDTVIPSENTNFKGIAQESVLHSKYTKNVNMNKDSSSSFVEAKSFTTDTEKQKLLNPTSEAKPMDATIIPSKSISVKDMIQEPLEDNTDKKQMNVNEDGLSGLNETKSFHIESKEQNLATAKVRPLYATIMPAKNTNSKGIIQEVTLDSKNTKHKITTENGLSNFNEIKSFQIGTEGQDLDNQTSQIRRKNVVEKLHLNQMPHNLIIRDSVSSENKDNASSSNHSIDSFGKEDNNANATENKKDHKILKLTSKDENSLYIDDVIVQNVLVDNRDKNLDLELTEKSSSLQKTPYVATDKSDLINEINPFKYETITVAQSRTSIEIQLKKNSSQPNVTDENARTNIYTKYVPYDQTPNKIEDLNKGRKQLIYPESAIDLPRNANKNCESDDSTSMIVDQLRKIDTESQNDIEHADFKYNLGPKYLNINTSESIAKKNDQEPPLLFENRENVKPPFDTPSNQINNMDDYNSQKPIKSLDDIGVNVISEHKSLDLDKERSAIEEQVSINNSQNEPKIASGIDSDRIFADKNWQLDLTPNFVSDVLSYRSKIFETENRLETERRNQPQDDPSSQISVNTDTLATIDDPQYADIISSVKTGPVVKNYDDVTRKASTPSESIIGGSVPIGKKTLPISGEIDGEVDEIINIKNQNEHDNFREAIDSGKIVGSNKEIDYTPQDVPIHYGKYDLLSKVDDGYSGIDSGIIEGFSKVKEYTSQDITKHYDKYDPLSIVLAYNNDTNNDGHSGAKINQNMSIYSNHLTKPMESTTFNQQVGSMSRNHFQNDPSRIRVENDAGEALLLNLTFQSYVNENGESIIRTFHPLEAPPRYVGDKITVVNSFIRPGHEIRIPVDRDHELALNLFSRKFNAPEFFDNRKNYTTNASLSEHVKLAARQRNDVLDKSLALIYERELIPLHNIIKNLTEEINLLSGQREHNLLSAKRTRSLRLVPTNNRCGCNRN